MDKTRTFTVSAFAALLTLCITMTPSAADTSGGPSLPAGAQARAAAMNAALGLDTTWREALVRAINPDDYECGPTDFDTWIGGEISQIDSDVLDVLFGYGVLDWATYYSLFFDNDASDDYIGVYGEHTQELKKRHKDNQRFWDVDTSDVLLQGMHGADVADDAKMVPTVQFYFDVDEATAQDIVDFVQSVIGPSIGYDHPFLTLNAFAFTAEGEDLPPGLENTPDKIVMGEGILEALTDMGLGDSGPDFVHAHEFGHHVQFELGVFEPWDPSDPDQPARTRYTELMADAFGSYYCAHARGATLQAKRIVDAVMSAYAVGDCAFLNAGHHGTPNQREASAEWGIDMAKSRRARGHIQSAEAMWDMFDDVYDDLVAPDAE